MGRNVPVKRASAAYSMTGRRYSGGFAEDFAKTPGPGSYEMVKPSVYIRNAPAFSMQGRSIIPGGDLYVNYYFLERNLYILIFLVQY